MCINCLQDSCLSCDDPCDTNGCKINLNTSCVFYNLTEEIPSQLTCIGVPNGTNLKLILEKFDQKLCSISGFSYTPFDLHCLRDIYTITNTQQFAEAVAREVCLNKIAISNLNVSVSEDISTINDTINTILTPSLTDNCLIGILPSDSLSEILQKILNKFCEILNINFTDQSPVINGISTSSIQFVTSGTKNHNILANLRVSGDVGNSLQVRPNGIFVPSVAAGYQFLTYDNLLRTITLSGGGGTITLPADSDSQTLSFNTLTNILSISNGNTVDLSTLVGALSETFLTANDSSTIDFTTSGTSNHTLAASVKVSGDVDNQLEVRADGLYVPISGGSSPLICFTFRLTNITLSDEVYSIIDCNGIPSTNITIVAEDTILVTGKTIYGINTNVQVNNLGLI